MAKFELSILGCGSATSTMQHLPSAQVLDIRNNLFMIDCGEGAQLQMRRMRMKFTRLNHIFLSHLHGDHCFGLPGLLSTMALQGRTGVVTVHTFEEGAEQFTNILNFFSREMPYKVEFNVIKKEKKVIYEDASITVTTIPLSHSLPTVGFLFKEKPKKRHINRAMTDYHGVPRYALEGLRNGEDYVTPSGVIIPNNELTTAAEASTSYAYLSDTCYSARAVSNVEGVEWMYHEATYANDMQVQAKKRKHSTTLDAARAAKEAHAKHLIIGHYSNRYTDIKHLEEEAKTIFPNTLAANEGMRIELLDPKYIL